LAKRRAHLLQRGVFPVDDDTETWPLFFPRMLSQWLGAATNLLQNSVFSRWRRDHRSVPHRQGRKDIEQCLDYPRIELCARVVDELVAHEVE